MQRELYQEDTIAPSAEPISACTTRLRISLTNDQRELLVPILDAAREENNYEGILCTIARHYSPTRGSSVLELQIVRVHRSKVAKLQRFLDGNTTLQ